MPMVKIPNDGDGISGGGPGGPAAPGNGDSDSKKVQSGGNAVPNPKQRRSDAAMPGDKGSTRQDRGFDSKKSASELIGLAHDYAVMRGLIPSKFDMAPSQQEAVQKAVSELQGDDLLAFNRTIATYAFGNDRPDLIRLAACGHEH